MTADDYWQIISLFLGCSSAVAFVIGTKSGGI